MVPASLSTSRCLPVIFGDLLPDTNSCSEISLFLGLSRTLQNLFKPLWSTDCQMKGNDSVEKFQLIHMLIFIYMRLRLVCVLVKEKRGK